MMQSIKVRIVIIENFKKGRKEGREKRRKAGQVTEYKHEDIHVET
jgi:hypothetical protein